MEQYSELIFAMMDRNRFQSGRIQHFLKVYEFARLIGAGEGISDVLQNILNIAAITHDIGIPKSEEKYGDHTGEHQEQEGPSEAKELLASLGYPEDVIERVCYLIGHHHTYHDIDGLDYQILIESDFLVNLSENICGEDACRSAYERIFRTKTGKRICRRMYHVRD